MKGPPLLDVPTPAAVFADALPPLYHDATSQTGTFSTIALSGELKWGGRNQVGAGTTIGEEVEQVNSFLSRAAICSKYMSKAVRTDMLTIQASGWNKRKAENLDRTLAKRYIKTVQRIAEATKDLEKLTAELSLQQDTVQQWVTDVQQWTSGPTIQNDLQRTIEGLYLGIKQRKFQLYRQSERAPPAPCGELAVVPVSSSEWSCLVWRRTLLASYHGQHAETPAGWVRQVQGGNESSWVPKAILFNFPVSARQNRLLSNCLRGQTQGSGKIQF
ncbi:hypothetical protein DPX16_16519 [Anabarilius grahami]|uniref:Uncharacterized protein n=1 Tax=Anabarilius grahami TaxID=495550 RepID=A0A3N0XUY5_ANAGA|nr:hypothetical protein DPX16_16519 [Anabarilius grahami]